MTAPGRIRGAPPRRSQTTARAHDASEVRRNEALLKTGALQNAILNSANFSSIATDEKGVIQLDLCLLSAVDGTRGVALARARLPDVILMDINLPGISGVEALKLLREDETTAHIPVIALSARAMPRDIQRGMDAGFFRYLTKPIKVKEFMDALNVALEFAEGEHEPVN